MHWILLMGFLTGCRTMTGIAVVCWCAHYGLIPVDGSWARWAASWAAVIVFTLAALSEYVADVLPQTPSRKSLGPALARVVFAALVGAICATSQMEPVAGGVIAGVAGALIGIQVGYWARMRVAAKVGSDLPVGLAESAIVLVLAVCNGYWLHMSAWRAAMIEAGKMHGPG